MQWTTSKIYRMSDITNAILKKMAAKIIVDVSASAFVFLKGEKMLSLETCVYLAERNGRYIVLGVGQAPTGPESGIRVDLFDPKPLEIRTIQRSECLEAFMKYANQVLFSRKSHIKPRIYFRNAESLSSLLMGYQWVILRSAAETAGALTVEFVDYEYSKTDKWERPLWQHCQLRGRPAVFHFVSVEILNN